MAAQRRRRERRPVEQIRVRVLPDGRMDSENAARYIGIAAQTLRVWALRGKAPAPKKVAGRNYYYRSDLDAFINGSD